MARRSKYPQELMDRGVRMALESGRPVAQIARDLGIGHEALRKRVRQAEADGGLRPRRTLSSLRRGRALDLPDP